MRSFKKPSNFGGGSRDSGRTSERSFKRSSGSSSSGRPSGSTRFGKPGRSFGSKESKSGNGFKLHEAVCDKCGQKCDLPFEPTQGKPIYCRSCFREQGSSSSGSSSSFKEFQPRDRFESRDHKFDRPVESKSDVSSEALDKINKKLDKIMKALKIE
jgi:CxxC-x17-CxxC domain-containing protein